MAKIKEEEQRPEQHSKTEKNIRTERKRCVGVFKLSPFEKKEKFHALIKP